MLSPLLGAGYTCDDTVNSTMPGLVQEQGTDAAHFTAALIRDWLVHLGRFYPLAFYQVFLHSWVTNLYVFNALAVLTVLADLYLFGRLVAVLTDSPRLGLLAAVTTPLLFQHRGSLDPILGFHFMLPLVVMYLLGSLLCLDDSLRTGRTGRLGWSVLLFALGALTYEVVYTTCVLHVLLALYRSPRELTWSSRLGFVARRSWPLVVTAVGFVALAVGIRLAFGIPIANGGGEQANPYAMNLNPVRCAETLLRQVYAALPLTWLAGGGRRFGDLAASVNLHGPSELALLLLGYTALVYWLLRGLRAESAATTAGGGRSGPLFVLGLTLLVAPGLLPALSPRIQAAHDWGSFYVPVYFSCFGVALLFLTAVRRWARRGGAESRGPALAVAVTVALVAAVTFAANQMVVAQQNYGYLFPRLILTDGLREGLIQEVPDGARVLVNDAHTWLEFGSVGPFIRQHASKHVEVIPREHCGELVVSPGGKPGEDVYYLSVASRTRGEGFALVGRLERLRVQKGEPVGLAARTVCVYVQVPFHGHSFIVQGNWLDGPDGQPGRAFVLGPRDLERIRSGRNWGLYRIDAGERLLDLRSLQVHVVTAEPALSDFGPSGK
jgi:hypothetical protein